MNDVDELFFGVEVGFGTPTKNGVLLLLNNNDNIMIPNKECSDCGDANSFYDPYQSDTYVEVMNVTMDIGKGVIANLTIGNDLICLGGADGEGNSTVGLCLNNTNFALVNELNYTNNFSLYDFELDGIFGMGRPNTSIPLLD